MTFQKMAALVSAFSLTFALVAPFYTNSLPAEAVSVSVELTPAETLALYGTELPAYYCAYPGDYRETTYRYIGTGSGGFYKVNFNEINDLGEDVFNVLPSVSVANTYTYLVYICTDIPYGGGTSETVDFTFQINPSVDLRLLSLRTSLFYGTPDAVSSPAQYMASWDWVIDSETVSFYPNVNTYATALNYFFFSKNNFDFFEEAPFQYDCVMCGIPVLYTSDSKFHATSSSVTVYRTSPMPVGNLSYYLLLLQCPILSEGYSIGGGGGGSGNVTGSIDEDGNIILDIPDYSDYLQQILDKLDEIAANQGFDQLTSDQQQSFDNLGSQMGSYDSAAGENQSLESQIYSDYNPQDFLDNAEFFEPDEDMLEAAGRYSGLFDVQIVATMIFIVMTVSIMSFVIFGKWG